MIPAFQVSDDASPLTAGASKVTYNLPIQFQVMDVVGCLTTPQSTGSVVTVDIKKNGTSIFTTPLTFDNGKTTTRGATVPFVFGNTLFNLDDRMTIDVLQIGDGTAVGLKITLNGYQPAVIISTPSGSGGGTTPPTLTQVDRTTGTPYGNLTAFSAGNAAAFDGVTNQSATSCAAVSHANGWVGEAFPVAYVFKQAKIFGTNSGEGFTDLTTGPVTISIYGKNSAVSSGSDGTLLGSITFNNTTNESAGRTIDLSSNTTGYTHGHAYIVGTLVSGAPPSTYCAELQFFA